MKILKSLKIRKNLFSEFWSISAPEVATRATFCRCLEPRKVEVGAFLLCLRGRSAPSCGSGDCSVAKQFQNIFKHFFLKIPKKSKRFFENSKKFQTIFWKFRKILNIFENSEKFQTFFENSEKFQTFFWKFQKFPNNFSKIPKKFQRIPKNSKKSKTFFRNSKKFKILRNSKTFNTLTNYD